MHNHLRSAFYLHIQLGTAAWSSIRFVDALLIGPYCTRIYECTWGVTVQLTSYSDCTIDRSCRRKPNFTSHSVPLLKFMLAIIIQGVPEKTIRETHKFWANYGWATSLFKDCTTLKLSCESWIFWGLDTSSSQNKMNENLIELNVFMIFYWFKIVLSIIFCGVRCSKSGCMIVSRYVFAIQDKRGNFFRWAKNSLGTSYSISLAAHGFSKTEKSQCVIKSIEGNGDIVV